MHRPCLNTLIPASPHACAHGTTHYASLVRSSFQPVLTVSSCLHADTWPRNHRRARDAHETLSVRRPQATTFVTNETIAIDHTRQRGDALTTSSLPGMVPFSHPLHSVGHGCLWDRYVGAQQWPSWTVAAVRLWSRIRWVPDSKELRCFLLWRPACILHSVPVYPVA